MKRDDDLIRLLQAGAKSRRCGIYLYHMNPLSLQFLYNDLETERLTAKYARMSAQHDAEHMSWDQIAYINIIQYIGDMRNRGNYNELSHRVGYETIRREYEHLESIEALLIGAAGLFGTLPRDSDSRRFIAEGEYLLHKHKITPLKASQWSKSGVTNRKTPIIRLAQMARIIYDNEHLLSRAINCRSRNDVFNLCNVSASSYISKYFGDTTRHIGAMTSDIVGINAIVPLQYAYGHYSGDDELISLASNLNESLPAERNTIVKDWQYHGVAPVSAYETQALNELSTSYCNKGRCRECIVYRHMISNENELESVPNFLNPQLW